MNPTLSSGVTILLLAIVSAIVWPFRNGLLWGFVFAGVSYPLFLQIRTRLGHGASAITTIVITILGCALPLAGLGWFVTNQVLDYADGSHAPNSDLDAMIAQLQNSVDPVLSKVGVHFGLADAWREHRAEWLASVGSGALQSLKTAGNLLAELGIGVFAQFFILRDAEKWRAWGRNQSGLGEEAFDRLARIGFRTVQAVFNGVVVIALIQTIIISVAYMMVGIEDWFLLGVLTGILCVVPFMGAPAVYIPVAIILISEGNLWQGILLLAVGFGIVSQVDNLLRPFFIAGKTGLHPLAVFVSILGGILLMGPVGMIMGPVFVALLNELWSTNSTNGPEAPETVDAGST